jgi:tRNA G26 N,N-dimethylase Trm1
MAQPLLNDEHIAILEGRDVSIMIATRDSQQRPHMTRAYGCRLNERRDTVTAWITRHTAVAPLEDIASNGLIALVASHVRSFRTLQIKGCDASLTDLHPDAVRIVRENQTEFVRITRDIGYEEAAMRALHAVDARQLVAVRFTIETAFVQTPGPNAGHALGAAP